MTGDVHSRNSGHPSHALTEHKTPLRAALIITAAMMLVETAGGFLSGSLALLADAGHMLTDAAALGLSLFAFWLSGRPKTNRRTFGWRRFEIFAALVNGLALWAIAAVIGYEAFKRLSAPPEIKSGLMMAVAVLGLAANVVVGALLFRGRERSLNIKGAFLHVMADALGSVGVLAAALLIKITGSFVWDPIVSVGVCVLILWSSGRLVRESFHVFMEGAPGHLDVGAIEKALAEVPGVVDVHDLHVWTITSGFVSLSAHLKISRGQDVQRLIGSAHAVVSSRFGVLHSTFQPEIAEDPGCETHSCPENGPDSP
jgi:cobalt-zinc-cadmium efflux system protein